MKLAIVVAAVGASLAVAGVSAQQAPVRAIEELKPGFYRAQSNQHYTVFLVTSDGIILSDPISTEFATWLKAELGRRFAVPVRYVLYSHHHWDHASGGAVFADTAEFVGQSAMPAKLALLAATTPLPAAAAASDANRNGRIERAEAAGALADQFALHDADGDGVLTGAEVTRGPLRDVHPPGRTFGERTTVTLGGKTVEMIHIGPTHSEDMTVLRFPAEEAVFLVDFISLKRLPFRTLGGVDVDELIATIADVERLDFTMAVGGHGSVGDKSDVAAHRRYWTELRAAVADGIAKGQTVEQMQTSLMFTAYSDWANYREWRTENIAGMHAILTAN
jgi:glyoxylase-like metal-dependent hydrolase (beta-lactamase superfamily II)